MSDKLNTAVDSFGGDITKAFNAIDYQQLFPVIRTIVQSSIEENFMVGGRFGTGRFGGGTDRWKESRRAKKQSGQTLQDTGQLAASIRVNVYSGSSKNKIVIEAGSNKPYAAIHNFGGTINHPGGTPYISLGDGFARFISNEKAKSIDNVKYTQPHVIKMPARPFLVLQDEDVSRINAKMIEFLGRVLG